MAAEPNQHVGHELAVYGHSIVPSGANAANAPRPHATYTFPAASTAGCTFREHWPTERPSPRYVLLRRSQARSATRLRWTVREEHVLDFRQHMAPGTYAVIAEIRERATGPLDDRMAMAELGTLVRRRNGHHHAKHD